MIASQNALRSQLEKVRHFAERLPDKYHYCGPYDFVLREGQFFLSRPLPKEFELGAITECFLNAFQTAVANEVPYVEGYAFSSDNAFIPHLHAWNVDAEGFVVDTTWGPVGAAYLGVIFPLSLVYCTRGSSVIDNCVNHWPLLRESWQ